MSYENAAAAAEFIRSRYPSEPQTAIVLGSGLGAFADEVANAVRIPYEDIPGFARSTVEGHAGQLVLGEIGGVSVAVGDGVIVSVGAGVGMMIDRRASSSIVMPRAA